MNYTEKIKEILENLVVVISNPFDRPKEVTEVAMGVVVKELSTLIKEAREEAVGKTVNNIQKLLLLHTNLEIHYDGEEIILVDKDKFYLKEQDENTK